MPAFEEKDILDSVETEQRRAEFLAGVDIAVLRRQACYLGFIRKGFLESHKVERPGVDMRVYSEIRSGAPKEGLGLFPVRTGCKESLAGLVDIGLGDIFP